MTGGAMVGAQAQAWGLSGATLWATLVVVSVIAGLIIYFGFGGWLYWRYYIRRRHEPETWKIQPKRFQPDKLRRWGVKVAFWNMVWGGVLSGSFLYYLLGGGYSALYFDIDEYGVIWTLVSTVLMFLAIEAAAYYAHLLLHQKWMFKHIHRWHHRLVAPTPFNTVTMHPADFTLLQVAAFIPAFIIPTYIWAFFGLLAYALIYNLMDHSGIKITHLLPWHSSSSFHDDHHVHFHCNYGQHIAIFDRLHGTHRRQSRRYGEDAFGGAGTATREGEQLRNDWVRY